MAKRLYRSEKDKIIGGVCAGIADYLNIDPVIIRILFLIALISEGFGLALYIILWIIVPSENSLDKSREEVVEENAKEIQDNVERVTKGVKKSVKSDSKKK